MTNTELFYTNEKKLKKIIKSAIAHENCEKALSGINALSVLLYHWNQHYTDNDVEQSISELTDIFKKKLSIRKKTKKANEICIMFYDSFGLDLRGLAIIYLKALTKLNCKLVYVTYKHAKGKQPIISEILEKSGALVEYIDDNIQYSEKIKKICEIYSEYTPDVAFEYNQPWDVAGIIAFNMFDKTYRFKINLTDHAFWSGINSFDYCIEFRDYGANISEKHRMIPKKKLIKLPFYPYINNSVEFQGFPFDLEGKKVIFSGGSLYKTIGENNVYYSIVKKILMMDENIIFLYAGSGDDSELKKVIEFFPGRVFHIPERNDLIRIMENSYLYLSTYPMAGGLMSQYAAAAGCLPITLKRRDGVTGILINEDEVGTTYDTVDDLIAGVERLLTDTEYKKNKEELLKKSLISEEEFAIEIEQIVTQQSTNYEITKLELDLQKFQDTYKERFNQNHVEGAIAGKSNKNLIFEFPMVFFNKAMKKLHLK